MDVDLPRARHARRADAVAAATARSPLAGPLGAGFGALVVVVAVVAVLAVVPTSHEPAPQQPAAVATSLAPVAPVATSGSEARSILHRWDAARAHAWSTGDLTALAHLYTPRSLAGSADVAMLRRWRDRGLQVTGLHMQVRELDVVTRSPALLVVRVIDRETGAVARTPRGVVVLPRDRPTRHTIRLERVRDGTWRVATVT